MLIEPDVSLQKTIDGVLHISDKGQNYLCSGLLHSPCVRKIAILFSGKNQDYLDIFSLNGCPEYINHEGHNYQYSGVSDGMAFYSSLEVQSLEEEFLLNEPVKPKNLIEAINNFLEATKNECYQPGSKQDSTRIELLNLLKLESLKHEHNLNAHTYPQYNCLNCSNLLSRLKTMLDNLPGLKGIRTENGHIGSKYVDYGYQEAINRIILIITNPDYKNENTFELSNKPSHSERVQS